MLHDIVRRSPRLLPRPFEHDVRHIEVRALRALVLAVEVPQRLPQGVAVLREDFRREFRQGLAVVNNRPWSSSPDRPPRPFRGGRVSALHLVPLRVPRAGDRDGLEVMA